MKQKLRKPVAWLLTFAMLFTMLPGAALAAEAEHLCSCGTDDESIHATTCAAYIQPENPVCYCAEPCTEANEWCDVCGFDYTACTGTEEATSYFTNPTGKEYIPYTGASQVLINATSADSGYTWGYFAYGSSADPIVNFPNSWETPTAADVDRYTIHCFHVDNAVKDNIGTLVSQYNGKPNASLTVYIYPVVSTDPVAATGLVADGTAKTLITSEGRVSGGQNGDVLYAVTSSSATKPDSFSTAQPTATEPGTYKVWFKAWAQGPDRNPAPLGVTAPDSAARSITVTVADPNACPHEVYKNGFCDCGAYQPAELKNGYYQISNGGQLFWFANHVNTVDRTANAILTADIDLENRPWTPIGSTGENSNNFRGHFDGDGHTIEGLKVEGKRAGLGFFGEVRTGTVENFTIYGEVNVIGSHDYVGGVIGSACGLNSSDHGLERNGATIRNITSYVNLTAGAHGIGMVGGFIGYANHQSLIENCAWYGTFDAGIYRVDSGAGGFVGRIYDTATVTIRNCAAYGTVKTAYQSGTHNNYDTIYIGGFLSFSPSGAKTVLKNNLWAGQIINNTNLTEENAHLSAYGTMNSDASKNNCYALEGTPYVTTNDANKGGITTVTAAQLASGEVAYLLSQDVEGDIWGQDIGTDDYPILGGETVYYGYDSCADDAAKVYTNVSERPSHSYTNGFCTNCDGYEPAVLNSDGYYEISNAGQLYWFAAQVNGGNKAINGKLMENITVNTGVLNANGGLNSGDFRVWTPIGNEDKQYSGTFDGNGKTVSGLYYNNGASGTANRNIGLFGVLNGAAVQDVSVSDSYLYGFQKVSGIAGVIAGSSTITGCTNSATVGGSDINVGGIVGSAGAGNSSITDCTNTGSITGGKNNVGGIAGSFSSTGRIANCTNTGSVSGTGSKVGGIAGYFDSGTVENCYNTGSVGDVRNEWVGGIAGHIGASGIVNNCYNIGAVSGSSKVGGVVGYNLNGTITNCYYLDTSCTEGLGTVKTAAQFASGEVAYLLGDAFGQTIGEEEYPVLGGAKVYQNNDCAGAIVGYSNIQIEGATHDFDDNGFCTNCGGYEPAVLNSDGYYEISNAGQLYWFAAQVNGGNKAINGKLMENITVNENVLDANGGLNSGDFRAWTPIGCYISSSDDKHYTGTFDGNGKTVSGLYFNDSATNYVGLFGYIYSGTVQNVGVVDSYLHGNQYAGGIVGLNAPGSIVMNCYNTGVVNGSSVIGGVVGRNSNGWVWNCYNTGSVSGSSTYVGGVAGYNDGVINNCYNTGNVSGSSEVGGVAGYNNSNDTVMNSYNIGNVSGNSNVGGVVGYNLNGTVTNCYYLDTSCMEGLGTVKTAAQFASGEVAYLLNGDQSTITFKQTIGEDAYPNFTGATVYAVTGCNGAGVTGYSNTEGEKADHDFGADGKCTNDGCTAIGYMLWVGVEQVTSEKLTINGTTGTATYDPGTNTLTLNNYTYEGAGHTWNEPYGNGYFMKFSAAICYGGTDPIRLVLNGESTVVHTGTSDKADSCGIYTNGSIEILDGSAEGIGSLTANGGPTEYTGSYSYGVYARGCSITVTSGSLTAIGGTAKDGSSTGMHAHNGSIEVTGGSLTGIGGEANSSSTGVCADKDIVISGSGAVVATGGDSGESSHGVATYSSIQVTGGSLNATCGMGLYSGGYALYAKVLTMGTGYGIVTPVGGKFDAEQRNVVDTDGNPAKEVKIAEKPVTYYDLWVGGEQVTSEKLTISGTSGTAAYDPEDNTLTLNNYTYEGAGYNDAAIYYSGGGTLKLVLVNDNSIAHTDATYISHGIYVEGGSITISGSGSLTVTADDTPSGQSVSYGIFVSGRNLTILGGTVTATGGKASGNRSADSCGICVQGTITISGGTVTATGGEVSEGKTAGCSSIGLYAYGDLTILGGTVTAASGTVNGEYSADSIGVLAHSGLTLGEGIGILTPVGGSFDADKRAVVDAAGKIATEVKIAEMPDPVKVQLKLTKEFNAWGKAESFTFNLAAVTENAPKPASLSATATEEKPLAYFGEITYTAEGTYEYTITEVDSGIPGVTYDTSAHKVVVTIENTEGNKLIAEVKYDGGPSLTITNTYTEATRYPLWIGGTQVTSHNAADVFGDGTVSYDADSNTLTLNSYTYEGPGYTWENDFGSSYGAAIYYGDTETLNLLLEGDSVVTHTGGRLFFSCGLYAKGNVVVDEGDDGGSLTITGGTANNDSYGVRLAYGYDENYNPVGGELILNSGSLIATGGISQLTRIGIGAKTIAVHGGSLIAKAMPLQEGEDLDIDRWGLSCEYADNSITFADGFGIQTPVGGIVAMGSVYNSYEDAENYADPADYVEIGAGYTVTAAFAGVDGKDVGGTVSGAGFYRAGANVTLTITPDTGCELKSVTAVADGSTVNGTLSGSTYTFTMPENDVVVTVTMERLFTPYDLWVGGEQFTDKNLTISDGKGGTATYDPDSNTLTLDGYTYEGAGHTWEEAGWGGTPFYYGAAIYYSGTETLNLILKGDSSVTHTGSADMSASYGLYAKGNVVVSEGSASGSLAVTGGTAEFESHGVCLKFGLDENLMHVGGELTINSGSLTAIAGAAQQSYGVYANTSITVSGSLTATGGTAKYNSYGVYLMDHNGTITVSGSLHAIGDNYGVYAYGSITVSGSLHATSNYYAVDANGITVSGSLTATGGESALCTASLTLGEGIGILTPVGGRYDEGWWAVVDADGNTATEVEIGIACDHSGNENQHTDCTVDLICSVCGEVVTEAAAAHTPGADDGDCTTAVKCTVCGTVTTPAKEAHTPGEDDGDCTTAIKCTVCSTVTTPAKEAHTPGADDGDCTTAIKCTVCGTVTTPAKEAHTPGEDDGDCTTAVKCTVCGTVTTPAKEKHTPEADDGDCTTAIKCTVCGTVTTPAKEAHTPGEDDGDCTTAIECSVCGTVTTPAKEAHTPGEDDGDCTTAIKCTVCDKNAVEAKTHSDGEDDNHACDNSGCTVDNVDGGHHGGTATCVAAAVCAECGQSYGDLGDHTGELQWIQTPATHKQIYVCCGTVVVNETSHAWGEDNICTTCHYGCTHTYENPVFVWQADFSAAKVTVTCSNCEDVKELNCEISSQWDADTLTFTATAGEYTDTQTIQLAVVGGKLTITNSAAEADEAIDMIIMIAGYTSGGKMTGCQVIEDVSGVTEQNLTFSGDTVKVFFLKPGTYAPLFACAEL